MSASLFRKMGHGALEVIASPFRAVGEPLRAMGQFGDDFADVVDQHQNAAAAPESAGGRKRRSIRKHRKHSAKKAEKSHSRKNHSVKKSRSRKHRSAVKSAMKSEKSKKSNPKSRKSCSIRKMRWVQKSEDDKKAHCRKKHNRK